MYRYEKETFIIKSETSKKSYKNTLLLTHAACITIAILGGLLSNGFQGFLIYILFFTLPVSILIHLMLNKLYNSIEIIVTNYGVYCRNYFKDEIFIPLNSITSVATYSKFLNSMAFTSFNNTYSVCYIENRQEIYDTVNKLISQPNPCGETAELFYKVIKYKSLYDEGVIALEEFAIKKKQLLDI